jgi:hypothetical protein
MKELEPSGGALSPKRLVMPRAPWAYVLGGVGIIFGFLVTWIPLWIGLGILELVLSGARGGTVPIHSIHVVWRYTLFLVTLGVAVWVAISAWHSMANALVQKRSRTVAGLEATAGALAAVLVILAAGECARVMSWLYGFDGQDTKDPLRTSANASARLTRDASFPLTGFWQTSCGNGVGFAIEREAPWLPLYRFEACGSFGCGYIEDSTIVRDYNFRVIDRDAIVFWIRSGDPRNRPVYHRCG